MNRNGLTGRNVVRRYRSRRLTPSWNLSTALIPIARPARRNVVPGRRRSRRQTGTGVKGGTPPNRRTTREVPASEWYLSVVNLFPW